MNSTCSFDAEPFLFQRYSRLAANSKIPKPHLVSQHVRATTVHHYCRCVRGARRRGELLVGRGCLGQITGRQRDLSYPSLRATDDKAACVFPETLMLGHVRGWVALEWEDTGSGSRLFLLIIIYITIIPSPSSFCSPRLRICAISGRRM